MYVCLSIKHIQATVILNTRWWLYVRPAGSIDDNPIVERYPMQTKKFITPESLEILSRWTSTGQKLEGAEQERMLKEEQDLFRSLLGAVQQQPQPNAFQEQPVFRPALVDIAALVPVGPAPVHAGISQALEHRLSLYKMKEELLEEFTALHATLDGLVIDVELEDSALPGAERPREAADSGDDAAQSTWKDVLLKELHEKVVESVAGPIMIDEDWDQVLNALLEAGAWEIQGLKDTSLDDGDKSPDQTWN